MTLSSPALAITPLVSETLWRYQNSVWATYNAYASSEQLRKRRERLGRKGKRRQQGVTRAGKKARAPATAAAPPAAAEGVGGIRKRK